MGFLGVYRALYDYVPQAQGELAIQEGDVLYVLEKDGGDGWWKAKKKAGTEDEDEPEGLIPHNYVQEAPAICHARALYEYTRQTDEELSFPEDALLEVFDTGDPDWILVGMDDEFGFVPANYIEMSDPADAHEDDAAHPAPSLPARPASIPSEPTGASESVGAAAPPAAAALASVLAGRAPASPVSPSSPPAMPSRNMSTPEQRASEDESLRSPALPSRPRPATEPSRSRYEEPVDAEPNTDTRRVPGGFHMYNINEMVSVMGKRKKMPTTLGINLGTGVILIAPERASDGPSQEWSAEKMTHYSREGKHVFMELVKPSKSVDFHAGAKDTAEEIVGALGEMAGAVRAEGLKEVIMAGSSGGRKRGQVLYDFMAQGDDEVTVAVGDEVIIVDDSKSEEWWQVRRIKNGKEGVVPSSYVEITGVTSPAPTSGHSHGDSIKSTVEQNRLEEVRLTKEALRASKEPQEVGPGMPLPERGSSLAAREHGNDSSQQRSRRENGRTEGSGKSKSKPDSSKVRTWTDRSKSFSVEAQFLGLKDGKIHLHKMNGVKIAVPIAKMSREDLEYVENATGLSLDDDKPLADVKRSKPSEKASKTPSSDAARGAAGASANKKPEYDWFQFFLDCDVAVGLCERYAQAFLKDSMDESVLPDVDANVLRQLGLREGDIIKVMRYLDNRFGRKKSSGGDGDTEGGGLFSGPGGALRNNTRKGRPAPAVQTSDVVDPKAFSGKDTSDTKDEIQSPLPASSPPNGTSARPATSGFDDDAWDVKPSKQQPPPRAATVSPAASGPTAPPQQPALTGSMQELSLLTAPLQPSRTEPVTSSEPTTQAAVQPQPNAPQQPQGATPSFFSSVSPQATARQRPLPPQTSPVHGGLVPPPGRPLSAPQSAQPYAPPPGMAPQMTGAMQGRPAAPGQSLNEITQARLQQQYLANMQQQQQVQPPPQQPMMTGYMGQQMQPMNSMYTGAPQQYMQPMMTGSVGPSPFADPGRPTQFSPIQSQPTGFQQSFTGGQPGFPQQTAPGGINNYLPPALEPQRTGIPGIQPQPTGMNSFGQQAPPQPLQPQKTGPAPPVRFGVAPDAKKLTPQATGRRANLSQASESSLILLN